VDARIGAQRNLGKMKKKIYSFFLLILLSVNIYSQSIDYIVTQDSCSSTFAALLEAKVENNFDYEILKKNTKITLNLQEITGIYGNGFTGYNEDYDTISEIRVKQDSSSEPIAYPLDYLKLVDSITLPGISIDSTKKYKKESMLLIPSYYYKVLEANNIKSLFTYETYWKNGFYDNINNNRYDSWTEIYYPNYILITNSYVKIGESDCDQEKFSNYSGLITNIEKLNYKKTQIQLYNLINESYSSAANATFETLNSKQNHYIILEYDGDYVDIYLDSDTNKIGTYVISSDVIERKLKELAENQKTTINDIVWPHHADGTSEYEKIIREPKIILSDGSTSDIQINQSKTMPSTNVTLNKTMLVNENLKLRSGEATSTQVLTVMQAGTKVKILELGKPETIDGINSNWVKVEVQTGAKDRDGKPIKSGTIGWCYGGYLK
jgi:hypothetical protein